jgi:hypothetical protein
MIGGTNDEIKMKIRYFMAHIDKSCILTLTSPNYINKFL